MDKELADILELLHLQPSKSNPYAMAMKYRRRARFLNQPHVRPVKRNRNV
jgi:hypothetical protein